MLSADRRLHQRQPANADPFSCGSPAHTATCSTLLAQQKSLMHEVLSKLLPVSHRESHEQLKQWSFLSAALRLTMEKEIHWALPSPMLACKLLAAWALMADAAPRGALQR